MCEFFVGEVEWVCLESSVVNYVVWQLMWVVFVVHVGGSVV